MRGAATLRRSNLTNNQGQEKIRKKI
uniref:Uncharacterized protein n=1 Tax=Triticum urartu TaxID=4572 RepID=A0A8R7TZN3_TRIUA